MQSDSVKIGEAMDEAETDLDARPRGSSLMTLIEVEVRELREP
jgi:hypothetical protein